MHPQLSLVLLLVLALAACASARDVFSDTWVAHDGLHRTLATGDTVGGPREGKAVGMFYWLWHTHSAGNRAVNIQAVLDEHPEAMEDPDHPAWGPLYAHHWWNEPVFGFYRNTDEWVARKHGEMLADMGVDVIIIDATNGELTWEEGYETIFRVWSEAKRDGVDTPKLAFMCAFAPINNIVMKLYENLYSKGIGEEHWFYWKGKPLIMAYPDNVPEPARSFFTFRPGQPLYHTGPVRDDQWGWLEIYPQHGFAPTEDGGFEQATVGVAQNYSEMKNGGNTAQFTWPGSFGRSYHGGHQDPDAAAMYYGMNFQEQWERGLEIDPEFLFITGFNEWTAMRFPYNDRHWGGQPVGFVDQFNNDKSRDVEPTKGRLMDHFLYQTAHGIRRYKGARTACGPSEPRTIQIGGGPDQWRDVGPEFRAHRGLMDRNHPGAGDLHYTNDTARNDIIASKVCRDEEYVYFQVETAEDLSDPSGASWMWLFLNSDRNPNTGWAGYEVI
ncbi:MAG: hypothetical protein GF320_10585, partial [Armatimonadia bacterium]|nr:hypothetical protein [Armatimonadia bacterium]